MHAEIRYFLSRHQHIQVESGAQEVFVEDFCILCVPQINDDGQLHSHPGKTRNTIFS